MNAGERIKIMRKSLGLSAEYIAEKIGVSPSTIYNGPLCQDTFSDIYREH